MKSIKKIDIISLAKFIGLLSGGIYLVAGLAINIAVLIFKIPATSKFDILGFGSGALATFLVALLVGLANFIIGAILGWLYNVSANFIGGLKIELEDAAEPRIVSENKAKSQPFSDVNKNVIGNPQPQQEINQIINSANAQEENKQTI